MHKKIIVVLLAIGFNALNGAADSPISLWAPENFNTVIINNQTNATLGIPGYGVFPAHTRTAISILNGSNLASLLNRIRTSRSSFNVLAPATLDDEMLPSSEIIFKPGENARIIDVEIESFYDTDTSENDTARYDTADEDDEPEEEYTESTDNDDM